MFIIDYHHHTNHSFDSQASMQAVCEAAIRKGVKEICFTEHYSVNPLAPTYGHMYFDKYTADIQSCRLLFEDRLSIKQGIELCEPHRLVPEYALALHGLPLDFILGSIHNIDNQKLRSIISQYGTSAFRLYFEELYKMVATADIDVIAHFDLIKRYSYDAVGDYPFHTYKGMIQDILEKAIDRGIGLEINTSGLRNRFKTTLPSIDILKMYKDLGGEILTVGSDSHSPETAASHISDAYSLASECGFKAIYTFDKRKPSAISLPA